MILARTRIFLAHRARLVHAVTGERIPISTATLIDAPPRWTVRVRDGEAIVFRPDGPTTPTRVALTVAPEARARLVPPPDAISPWTVTLDLDDELREVTLEPAPADLRVILTRQNAPSTGRSVQLEATGGSTPRETIPLPEGDPGEYGVEAITWTAPFAVAELLVDGSPLRTLALDVHSQRTRIHLIDTI